jgi:hypothetical protein
VKKKNLLTIQKHSEEEDDGEEKTVKPIKSQS